MRRALVALAAGLAALAAPSAAAACALALVLAVDVSGSVNEAEFALQAGGLADAFDDPAVREAVEGLNGGMVAALTHWSGSSRQRQMTEWRHLTDAASLRAYAEELRTIPRAWRNFSTATGDALSHAGLMLNATPLDCARRVIDVSGDGVSNEGRPPILVRDALVAAGVTINGLVIQGADPDPVRHYETNVIGGPGAFVEIAADFTDFPRAIRRKLLREILQPMALSSAD
jgi:hypothetical protein